MLDRQRIDKWLWHARVVRTRSQAAALANSGYLRLNGARVDAASRLVRAGDVVTVALDRSVRLLKVKEFAERRGSAPLGRALYADLTPPAPKPEAVLEAARRGARPGPAAQPNATAARLIASGTTMIWNNRPASVRSRVESRANRHNYCGWAGHAVREPRAVLLGLEPQ